MSDWNMKTGFDENGKPFTYFDNSQLNTNSNPNKHLIDLSQNGNDVVKYDGGSSTESPSFKSWWKK
ncbi:MAG TPA: hypothetical protein PKK26_14075 [Candidatus Wallbacteria bacterium]|mgnify:CR=1 FL=1|nr:hypothetical protein [Candidatus Wallbacteria bacterium]